MKRGDIRARVEAIRAPVIAKLQYGLEQAMLEAGRALKVSEAKENGAAMVAAVTLRAKLNGLLTERSVVRHSPLDDMHIDDLRAFEQAAVAVQKARAAAR